MQWGTWIVYREHATEPRTLSEAIEAGRRRSLLTPYRPDHFGARHPQLSECIAQTITTTCTSLWLMHDRGSFLAARCHRVKVSLDVNEHQGLNRG